MGTRGKYGILSYAASQYLHCSARLLGYGTTGRFSELVASLRGTASVSDTELQAKPPNGGVHTGILTKLSLAVLSQTRIIAFRLSVPVGFGSRVTFAELIASAAYLAALLTWEFINSSSFN